MRRLLAWIKSLVVLLVLAGLGTAIYIYAGLPQVGADVEHKAAASWLLQKIRERSVERRARRIAPGMPAEIDERMLHAAVIGFEDMCASCHAPPGRSRSVLARGLNPPAPDLAVAAVQRSSKELFWVIRHGIRMTGMPAWGRTHSDEELWPLVALIARFPGMEPDEYSQLVDEARATGAAHDHDHGDVHGEEVELAPDEDDRHEHHHH